MGRVKTTFIKRTALKIFEKHKKSFSTDFSKNKKILDEKVDIPSKQMRNKIAGYITKLKKKEEK